MHLAVSSRSRVLLTILFLVRLYYDSECNDFATVLPLNTCVNTENYFSLSLDCIGGVECAA